MANLKVYILFALTVFGILRSIQAQDRIINGDLTTIDKAPYMMYMRFQGRYICDCTLIRRTKVLSAAHCVTKNLSTATYDPSLFKIHGGTSYLSDDGVTGDVIKIAVPSNWNYKNTLTHDVSILTLAEPMIGPNITPAPLCSNGVSTSDTIRVLGWGLTNGNNANPPNQLHEVMLNLITKAQCENVYGTGSITETMICAANPGKGTCHGDSGGPAMINGEVCGIVSWGNADCASASPSVFTLVNQVKAFILNNID